MTSVQDRARRQPARFTSVRGMAQAVLAVGLGIALVVSTTGGALATHEGGGGEGGSAEQPAPSPAASTAAPPPGANPEAAHKAYIALLFQEINVRRDRAATPRYDFMADKGSEAVDAYLQDLLPAMVEAGSCFHGSDQPGMRAGWDYLEDVGIDESKVGGEVLACPDVDAVGFWTPPGIADGWWKSPSHFKTLYGDQRPNVVACGAEGPINGGSSYETVACITLMGDK
jgi:hypothetical protein